MIWLVLASLGALAATDEEAPRYRGGIRLPPLRFDTRVTLRDGAIPGAMVEVGTRLGRTEHWAFEANVGHAANRAIELPGPWRSFFTWELTGEALYLVNRWVELGPLAGIGYRSFRQQGMHLEGAWVPMTGLRANLALLKARRWGIVLSTRAATELTVTRMVLETQQVSTLSPVEGQIGMRLVFGHGRRPAEGE